MRTTPPRWRMQCMCGESQSLVLRLHFQRLRCAGGLNVESEIALQRRRRLFSFPVAMFPPRSILFCLSSAFFLFVAQAANAESPYPASSVIKGVTWDFAHTVRLAPGSDLWPITWGADDNLYAAFGDGGGFGGTNDDGRASLGFARISGMPPEFTAVNIWGGKHAEHPAQFGGKSGSILSVDGVLYAICGVWPGKNSLKTSSSPHESRLIWSGDNGATWEQADWKFAEGTSTDFGVVSFLNFGRDYAGARDGYVYLYFTSSWWSWKALPSPVDSFLARVPKGKMADRSAYEFFSGTALEPKWTRDIAERRPVFSDPSRRSINKVIYNAPLKRYLATVSGAEAGQFALFDSPEPWGAWTTIVYDDNWHDLGKIESLCYNIPTKWISNDGTEFWMVYSSVGEWDSFNLVKGNLSLSQGH